MVATDNAQYLFLTQKEQRIIRMIADGKTNPQIAEEMALSVPTIKWYRKKLKAKFNTATTMEMVRKAIEWKIIK